MKFENRKNLEFLVYKKPSNNMEIQYISDIHLELMTPFQITKFKKAFHPHAKVLILAGDIGNPFSSPYNEFLGWISPQFEIVFIVAGNHEFYKNEVNPTIQQITEIVKSYPNIVYLENLTYDWNGIRFVGSTQWTRVKNPIYTINDTVMIKNFTPQIYNSLHTTAVTFLTHAIETSPLPIIVITHHVPIYELTDQQYRTQFYDRYNQWFSADLDELIKPNAEKLKAWFYGHTHTASKKNIYNVNFYCNPLGYSGENSWTEMNQTVLIS